MDIFISILTVKYENGKIIDNLSTLFCDYSKTWLVIDVCSIFPFDLVLNNNDISDFAKLPRIIKLLKIIRLIKFSTKITKTDSHKKLSNMLRGNKETKNFFSFFFLILVLTHITCCLWYFLTKIEEDNYNWYQAIPF